MEIIMLMPSVFIDLFCKLEYTERYGLVKSDCGIKTQIHSGSLKRIDYPKQICLAHPLSFECFHCS